MAAETKMKNESMTIFPRLIGNNWPEAFAEEEVDEGVVGRGRLAEERRDDPESCWKNEKDVQRPWTKVIEFGFNRERHSAEVAFALLTQELWVW